jgi:hypothetical protein
MGIQIQLSFQPPGTVKQCGLGQWWHLRQASGQ